MAGRDSMGRFLPSRKRNPRGVYKHRKGVRRATQDLPEGVRVAGYTQLTRNPRGVYRHRRGVLRAAEFIPEGVRVAGLTQLTRNPFGGIMPTALIVNPSRRRRRVRRRRRSSYAIAAAPRKRRKRRAAPRRRAVARPKRHYRARARRRAATQLEMFTPGGRVKRHRRRVRRNPAGFVDSLKQALLPSLVGSGVGFGMGMLDVKLLGNKPMISTLVKVALSTVGAALLGKKAPRIATAFSSGIMGTVGYGLAVKVGGGFTALTKAGALQGMAGMAEGDEEFAALLQGMGLGVLTPGIEGLGEDADADATNDYESVLADSDGDNEE